MTATIATNAAELEEILSDDKKIQEIVANKQLGEFVKNYVQANAKADPTIAAQVREEGQRVLAEFLKDQGETGAKAPVDFTPEQLTARAASRNTIYNPKAIGARIDDVFADAAEFWQASWHAAGELPNGADLRAKRGEVAKIQNAYSSTVPADGGFLIPENLRSELLALALETAVVRPRAMTIPMDSLRVPIPTVDDTSHVSSIFGGIVGFWTEEAAALVASSAKFGRVVLEAKKLTAYSEVPNELPADGPAFGAFMGRTLPQALSYYEDVAFIGGSGVGEPLGVMNGSALVAVTRGTASHINWVDVVKLYSRMLPASIPRAVWLIAPDALPDLLQMSYASGAPVAIWLPGGQGFDQPQLSLLGRPVIITEKVTALGTKGDLSFVDFGSYLLGDRQAMQAASSSDYKFGNDVTAYRVIERVDGRPWLNTPITPKNGSTNTLSPYVTLAT